jgi:hypothetical protein
MTGDRTRRGRTRRALRRLLMGAAALFVALAGLLSMGTAVGRYSAVNVDSYGAEVPRGPHELAVVVPVHTITLRQNDVVAVPIDNKVKLYRVEGVDSWTKKLYAVDDDGKTMVLKVGRKVSRVTYTMPHAGLALRLFHGPVAAILLFLAGVALLFKAVTQRRVFMGAWKVAPRRLRTSLAHMVEKPSTREARRSAELTALLRSEVLGTPAPLVTNRSFLRRKWWWTRLCAIVVAVCGVFSMTASATFTATATVSQGAITAGTMSITVPAACVAAANACAANAQNRLTLGATGLVPGDMLMRAVDVNIDSSTTNGIMTAMTLKATSSTSGGSNGVALNDASGIKVWVKKCSNAWTESGTSPAFSYTCGGGGSESDVLGSSLPTSPPAAGTCPPTAGSPTLSSLQSLGSALPLSNMTLTPNANNHLVIYMCLPTAMGNDYQTASDTITWDFVGTQRSATNK